MSPCPAYSLMAVVQAKSRLQAHTHPNQGHAIKAGLQVQCPAWWRGEADGDLLQLRFGHQEAHTAPCVLAAGLTCSEGCTAQADLGHKQTRYSLHCNLPTLSAGHKGAQVSLLQLELCHSMGSMQVRGAAVPFQSRQGSCAALRLLTPPALAMHTIIPVCRKPLNCHPMVGKHCLKNSTAAAV